MNTGAFLCSCGGTCDLDLESARDGVRDVDVVASSELLCEDGLPGMEQVVDEYELDQIIASSCDDGCREKIRALGEEMGLHPEATTFVDHREGAGWVHDEAAATDKTARLVNRTYAGLAEEPVSRTVSREAGDRVVVVGDADTAEDLADTADVTLVADGKEFADTNADLDDVTLERGQVTAVEGEFGEFELTLVAGVTEDCVSCMKCVREGPDGMVTSAPVDISLDAPDGEWTDVCPTDAIDLDGVERTIEADQVVYPGAPPTTRGGRIGIYTGPVDGGTIASVESLLGGVEKPDHLDLEMEVCAAGDQSKVGCNECVEACPHGAVDRPKVDEVSFDKVACQDCGACTSVCPTGATRLRDPSNRRIAREVESLLTTETDDGDGDGGWLPFGGSESGIETEVVAFVCSERAERTLREYGRRAAAGDDAHYQPILPVRVNCADTVGEAHVFHALAAGADGVAVVGCGGDCLHSGPDPKAALVERINRASRDLGLGERTAFFAPSPDDRAEFVDRLDAFVEGLDDSPVPSGEHRATGEASDRDAPAFNTHDWALESVRFVLDHADPEREVIRGLESFGQMTVSDACNLTPTCSTLCPTDAIRRTDDGDLQFNHERCVNCGLCEDGCPETAIEMETGLDLSLLPENRAVADGGEPQWSTVYEGEMVECARCGTPFTSVGTAEKVKGEVGDLVEGFAADSSKSVFDYCGDCRARLVYDGEW